MRRALTEWGMLVLLPASLFGFLYWGVSVVTPAFDFELTWGSNTVTQVATENGTVVFCDHLTNRGLFDLAASGAILNPEPAQRFRLALPGIIRLHVLTFADNSPVWSLDCSLLLPASLLLVLGTICALDYRRNRRARIAAFRASRAAESLGQTA